MVCEFNKIIFYNNQTLLVNLLGWLMFNTF